MRGNGVKGDSGGGIESLVTAPWEAERVLEPWRMAPSPFLLCAPGWVWALGWQLVGMRSCGSSGCLGGPCWWGRGSEQGKPVNEGREAKGGQMSPWGAGRGGRSRGSGCGWVWGWGRDAGHAQGGLSGLGLSLS